MKELKKKLPTADRERVTKQMERITNKRNRQVHHYLHTASKRIVDFLVEEEPVVEAREQPGEEEQPELCEHSACQIY